MARFIRFTVLISVLVVTVFAVGIQFSPEVQAAQSSSLTGKWTLTGSMNVARSGQTATLLKGGEVLVAGGANANNMGSVAVAELYNPRTGTWSDTGTMTDPRSFDTATRLHNGRVLVAGGQDTNSMGHYGSNTAEIYDPVTGKWTATPNMNFYRIGQTETRLLNGQVLVAGGGDMGPSTSAELFV